MTKYLVPPEQWQDPENPAISPLARPDNDKQYMALVKSQASYSKTDVDTLGIKALKFLFNSDGSKTVQDVADALGIGYRHAGEVMRPLRKSGLLHSCSHPRKGSGARPIRYTIREATRKMMKGDW